MFKDGGSIEKLDDYEIGKHECGGGSDTYDHDDNVVSHNYFGELLFDYLELSY